MEPSCWHVQIERCHTRVTANGKYATTTISVAKNLAIYSIESVSFKLVAWLYSSICLHTFCHTEVFTGELGTHTHNIVYANTQTIVAHTHNLWALRYTPMKRAINYASDDLQIACYPFKINPYIFRICVFTLYGRYEVHNDYEMTWRFIIYILPLYLFMVYS